MHDVTLRNGTVLTGEGVMEADVRIVDGVIAGIGEGIESDDVIDCTGCWVGPGLVDIHAHLREPGEEWKEDIASGSAAAAAGGYTAIVAMPNTDPATDAGHLARYIAERGREVGLVDVFPAGAVSIGRAGEKLSHIDDLLAAGVRVFTDDGDVVADAGLLRQAMDYIAARGGVIMQHAMDVGLSRGGYMHEGTVSSRLGMYGIPSAAEDVVVARDLELVALTGCRYHIQHVSTAGVVELVAEAKSRGLPVTAEVTPHHLMFDHNAVAGADPVYRMMPPLRSELDRGAVVEGLRSGVIDAVATDHAPHASHEKDVPFEQAPNGVIGLEWAAAVVLTTAGLDIEVFFDRLSARPAAIAQIDGHGGPLAVGGAANIVVFDPHADWTPNSVVSRSQNAPYLGKKLKGRPRHTILRGTVTSRDASSLAATT